MRRRYLSAVVVFAGVAVVLFVVAWRSHGPRYRGSGLNRWLRDLRNPSYRVQGEAQEAVRCMGSRIVPTLRKDLHATDSAITTNLVGLLQQQTLIPIPFAPARERRIRAALACVVLGPAAELAIPDLLVFSKGDFFCANLAESALARIGEPAVGPLSCALTNADFNSRSVAAGALVQMGLQAKAATPALIKCLKDDYGSIRADAARALARIGTVTPETIKPLVEAIRDPDPDVRCCALVAVTGFGQQTVPILSSLLNDTKATTRAGARIALERISKDEQKRNW